MATKRIKITKDLIIAYFAKHCPNRKHSSGYTYICDDGDGHPTNCNPRLCTGCTEIFSEMAKIEEEGKENYL